MFVDFSTIIPPDFDEDADYSDTWEDKINPKIHIRVYKRYRAPQSKNECELMIADLRRITRDLSSHYEEQKAGLIALGISPNSNHPATGDLRDTRKRITRFTAIARAYEFWLNPELNSISFKREEKTEKSESPRRIDLLIDAFLDFLAIYVDDLNEKIDPEDAVNLAEQLTDRVESLIFKKPNE